ncbi:MAG: hypothetical protein ACRDGD_12920 [Candidatus Limnocylindria bacterium]
MSDNDIHGIEHGWTVKSIDGHDVGSVEEATGIYILVKEGLINAEHRYLPAATLEHVRPEQKEIGISLTRDEVNDGDWSVAPTEGPRSEGAPLNAESDSAVEEIMDTSTATDPERPVTL